MTLSQAGWERTEAGTIVSFSTAQLPPSSGLISLSFYFSDGGACWRPGSLRVGDVRLFPKGRVHPENNRHEAVGDSSELRCVSDLSLGILSTPTHSPQSFFE